MSQICFNYFSSKSDSHICDLSEGLSAGAILDGLNSNRDLHCLSLWSPKALKHKLNVVKLVNMRL